MGSTTFPMPRKDFVSTDQENAMDTTATTLQRFGLIGTKNQYAC